MVRWYCRNLCAGLRVSARKVSLFVIRHAVTFIACIGWNPHLCIAEDFTKMKDIIVAFGDDQEARESFIAQRLIHVSAVNEVMYSSS